MAEKKSFYITTTLPYVNAEPHIGFAYELVAADVLARYHESLGEEIFFNTGTDEHGQKVWQKAAEEGKDTQAYVDEYAEKFKALKEKLGIHANLNFIRTTDPNHIKAAQKIWQKCFDKGDIYKKKYKGLYCVGDEAFIKETDLVGGRCPNHPNLELQEIEEENYFFKITNYKDYLNNYISSQTVIPERRLQEAKEFVNNLEDFSISREKSRLNWGVPVPNDDAQVMYVWFDALTSYISTLGWPDDKKGLFDKFWTNGETLQLAGKDQIRFQSIIWQAMLKSADLKQTDKVFYHGFINSGGQKMSKSVGNVISPDELVQKYGTEATRYLLLRHVHPFEDTDVTWERLDEWYNAGLANGLGNLTSRIMKMAETSLGESVNSLDSNSLIKPNIHGALDYFDPSAGVGIVWGLIEEMDEKIQREEPFKLVKTDPEKAKELIRGYVKQLDFIGRQLEIFLPETSKKIIEIARSNKMPGTSLFPRLNA